MSTDQTPALDDFKGWAKRILRLYAAAKQLEDQASDLRPGETSYGVLRIECYRYLKKLKRENLLQQLREYVETRQPGRWHRHKGNDADQVLRLLERFRARNVLTAPRRARIANELSLAYLCGVGSKWLLPFLYECGNEKMISEALAAGKAPSWTTKYRRASKIKPSSPRSATGEPDAETDGALPAGSTPDFKADD